MFRVSQVDLYAEHNIYTADNDDAESAKMTELPVDILASFNHSGQLSSLDTAIVLLQEALHLLCSSHAKHIVSLGCLAAAIYARYHHTGDMQNLDEVISVFCVAMEACPESDIYHADLLSHLSGALFMRFFRTGELPDLREGIKLYRNMLQATHYDNEPAIQLLSVAFNIFKQSVQSGQSTVLNTTISMIYEGIALLPVNHHNRSAACNNLAVALMRRFRRLGGCEDLYEAITLHRNALKLYPPLSTS
jgi:hypothetical protein